MTINSATMTDITWQAMEDAGLDTDRMERLNPGTDRDEWEYTSVDGQTRVCFSPATDDYASLDDDSEANLGWNITTWERFEVGVEYWDVTEWDWQQTVAEALASVKAAVDPNG